MAEIGLGRRTMSENGRQCASTSSISSGILPSSAKPTGKGLERRRNERRWRMNVLSRIETATSARPAKTRIYHGWLVVGAAFVIAFFAWGVGFYGPGIYLVA